MRIVFVMRNVGYFRNFEWVVRRLAERGHIVRVCFDRIKIDKNRRQDPADIAAQKQLEQVIHDHPKLVKARQFEKMHLKPDSLRSIAGRRIQLILDYLRYHNPLFVDSAKLRERAGRHLEPRQRARVDAIGRRGWSRFLATRTLSWLHRLIPAREYVREFLRKEQPDLLVVTPLVGFGEGQVEYFKAAADLGVRSCLPVASWDNLTSKGDLHARPGRVLVWNEPQKREAITLQRVRGRRVVVTGAHSYEHWFTWQPSRGDTAFKKRVGLDPSRGYLVFLCSSSFIAEDERPVILRWAQAIRESGRAEIADLGILIRPHPYNHAAWLDADLSAIGNAVIFPAAGANPVSRQARSDYFDTMAHCAAVVGVNTSAMIEASILGKPVHTILFDEMAETQGGTPHFSYLSDAANGLVRVAHGLAEHVSLLANSVNDPSGDTQRSEAFVKRFVWPTDIPRSGMVDCFVDSLEEQAKAPAPRRPTLSVPFRWVARVLASPLLLMAWREYKPIAERARSVRRERERRRLLKAGKERGG